MQYLLIFKSFSWQPLISLFDFYRTVDNCKTQKLTKPNFLRKFIFVRKWAKWTQNDKKKQDFFTFFFEFLFLLDLVLNETPYYQLCALTNPKSWFLIYKPKCFQAVPTVSVQLHVTALKLYKNKLVILNAASFRF